MRVYGNNKQTIRGGERGLGRSRKSENRMRQKIETDITEIEKGDIIHMPDNMRVYFRDEERVWLTQGKRRKSGKVKKSKEMFDIIVGGK